MYDIYYTYIQTYIYKVLCAYNACNQIGSLPQIVTFLIMQHKHWPNGIKFTRSQYCHNMLHATCNTYIYTTTNISLFLCAFTPCPCAGIWCADYTGFQDFHLICSAFNEKLFSNQLFALTFWPNNETNALAVAMSFWQDERTPAVTVLPCPTKPCNSAVPYIYIYIHLYLYVCICAYITVNLPQFVCLFVLLRRDSLNRPSPAFCIISILIVWQSVGIYLLWWIAIHFFAHMSACCCNALIPLICRHTELLV